MWSKQADTRNKQMTSFKNKISHRKRKNEKSKPAAQQPNGDLNNGASKNEKVKQKLGNKNKSVNEDVCDNKIVGPDLIEDLKQSELGVVDLTTYNQHVDVTDFAKPADDFTDADVVLRKKVDGNSNEKHSNDDAVKRYSDSFVIDNTVNHNDAKLSRAHSGFFLSSAESCEYIKEKKPRRFSDLFRHGSVKPTCDSAKTQVKMITHFEIGDNGEVTVKETIEPIKTPQTTQETKPKPKDKKSVKRTESAKKSAREITPKIQKPVQKANIQPKDETVAATNNSVLKRVRSKIYKHKTDNGVSAVPTMPDISENKERKSKNKNKNADTKIDQNKPAEMKKTSHFDFRLIRQTSNLERIRPKTFTHTKTQSVDSPAIMIPPEKPILAKSKSSSAINLNLLRSRRNKILDYKKNCKPVQDEFDFFTFGSSCNNLNKSVQISRKFGSQDLTSNLNNNVPTARRTSWVPPTTCPGETKPGNPVTRTPSDRRPDAVREESSRTQDAHSQSHDTDNDTTNAESSISLPASTGNKRRQHSNINRSESVKEQSEKNRKQRRNRSDPLHKTIETVDLDQQAPFHPHSGSSSNSSLSLRSLESPSSNADTVSDSDLEVEADPPDWKSALTEEQLSRLHPDEKKRQDVINEFFHTERSHVRNLKVLEQIFRKNIVDNKVLSDAELKLVFPNLVELLGIHNHYNTVMKNKKKDSTIVAEVGDILLNMFDGDMGNNFCNAAAKFCEKQQVALEFIKEKRKKDSKFESVLSNCEKNNHCRRLPLQGFIPQEMQRLSRYPLLLDRLIETVEKCPDSPSSELEKLRLALDKSKEILNRVNDAAKLAQNKARLEEIKSHLDTLLFDRADIVAANEFKNFDLTNHNLIHEGTVTLKRQNKTPLQVHMLLLEEAVILLQKEGERYVLKYYHGGGQSLSPIIRMSNVICRTNAADYVTLFLLATSAQNSHMYEIQCRDTNERKTWFKYLTDASEPYKLRDGKGKRTERNPDPEEEVMPEIPIVTRPETIDRSEASADFESSATTSSDASQRSSDTLEDDKEEKRLSTPECEAAIPAVHTASGVGVSIKLTANDWPLIQPSEVHVAIPPLHTAEPVLTSLEKIKRKDEEVKQALADKEVLVADLLSIPREDYHLIADIASDEATKKTPSEREPSELVLASVYQVDQLLAAVNDSLNVSEIDSVLATGGKHPACSSNESKLNNVPSVPVSRLQEIVTTLNSQLTILLSVVKQREDERDKLRKELHRVKEQLHETSNLHGPHCVDNDESTQLDSTQSGDLESIEESPREVETT